MASRSPGRRAAHAAEMRRIVASFASSGLTQAGFCRSKGVALSTFNYWRHRVRHFSSQSPFVEVELASEVASSPIELAFPGGVTATIGQDTSDDLLRRLLRAARQAC